MELNDSIVYSKTYTLPGVNCSEVLRYAGWNKRETPPEEIGNLLQECIDECEKERVFSPKVSYRYLPVKFSQDCGIDFTHVFLESENLKKNLAGCNDCIFFAATVGFGIDRMILKYNKTNSAKALLLQALGAERVEMLCDMLCEDEETVPKGYKGRPRFSPGYGDVPLEFQKELLPLVGADKNLGITLNESLLMSPSKSVTAIMGIEKM